MTQKPSWPVDGNAGNEGAGVPPRPLPLTPGDVALDVSRRLHGNASITLTSLEVATLVFDWFHLKEQVAQMTEELRAVTCYVDDLEDGLRTAREEAARMSEDMGDRLRRRQDNREEWA